MSKQARINVSGSSCSGRMVWRVLIYVCAQAYYVQGSGGEQADGGGEMPFH